MDVRKMAARLALISVTGVVAMHLTTSESWPGPAGQERSATTSSPVILAGDTGMGRAGRIARTSRAEGAEGFVAGTTPDRRPEIAPRVSAFEKSPEWFAQALRGVEQPIPPSLGFLNNQGGWYTPFNHKGMTPPYDIRGLHAGPAAGASNKPANAN